MAVAQVNSLTQAHDASTPGRLAAWRALGRRLDSRDPQMAREAASLLTSQLFFAPLLAEMRKLPFGREFGHGGRMEEAFGEQLDMRIADTVARSDTGLTAQLAEKLARSQRPANAVSGQLVESAVTSRHGAGAGDDR